MKRVSMFAAVVAALVFVPVGAADRPPGTGEHCAEQLTALEQRMVSITLRCSTPWRRHSHAA